MLKPLRRGQYSPLGGGTGKAANVNADSSAGSEAAEPLVPAAVFTAGIGEGGYSSQASAKSHPKLNKASEYVVMGSSTISKSIPPWVIGLLSLVGLGLGDSSTVVYVIRIEDAAMCVRLTFLPFNLHVFGAGLAWRV